MLDALIATYREYNLANHDRMVTVYPGIVAAVDAIRRAGRRTGLVTSKNRSGALRGLALAKLERMMDVLVCADEVANPKPHPEPVEKALALLGADPATTVYVGDSIHDMVSGRDAGVRTAAALWGPFGREHLGRRHAGLLAREPRGPAGAARVTRLVRRRQPGGHDAAPGSVVENVPGAADELLRP